RNKGSSCDSFSRAASKKADTGPRSPSAAVPRLRWIDSLVQRQVQRRGEGAARRRQVRNSAAQNRLQRLKPKPVLYQNLTNAVDRIHSPVWLETALSTARRLRKKQ